MSLRKMFIFTLGAKIKNLIQAFKLRVLTDLGQFEAESCLDAKLVELNDANILDSASLVVTPNGYKEQVLYSVVPADGTADLEVVRATTGTRVNADGLIETVGLNIPRIDYSNGSCPSILVEPQRTNLISHSSNLGVLPWNAVGDEVLLFPNEAIAPDGTMTAARYLMNAGSARTRYLVSITSGVTYTVSFWAKNISMTSGNSTLTGVGAPAFNYIPLINTTTWTRITYTFTATATAASANFRLIQSGNIGGEILFWGAQLEVGTNATSYIPTIASTVTRNADVISKSGLTGITTITETFEDDTTNVISGSPTSYTMSQGRIKKVIGI
jgi:hypothetical protein